jgi:hypothetical protein
MKAFSVPILCIVLFILTIPMAYAQKNYPYDSNEGKFSIEFPGEFTVDREDKDKVSTIKINCDYEGQTYFASYSLHKIEMVDHEEMAEVSFDSFHAAVGGEVLMKDEWKVDGNTGLMAEIDLAENSVTITYRVILVGNIQYQLIVMAEYSDYDKKLANKFFKSFELK